jgi:putative serine protease PepD
VWPATSPAAASTAQGASAASPIAAAGAPRRRRAVVVGAVTIAAVALVGTGMLAGWPNVAAILSPLAATGAPEKGDSPGPGPTSPQGDEELSSTVAGMLPSVVQIEAGGAVGSGFVAADGGLILTASHVVGRSDTVTLRLHDGTSVSGTVVAVDSSIDTAVIRAEAGATDLKPLVLGALADVQVGEMTIAVGSPFGLSQTVTTGIVSALGRTVPTPMGELHNLIQTDAAINSGNSGGPLADREGRAIGINTAIASASGGSDGIGFAVPIDQAALILEQVEDGSWRPEDNNPAEGTDPLGGLFDQFLGPDGLDGLRDLFGLEPDGSPNPDDPSDGSGMADQMLRQLLDELLRSLDPGVPAPEPPPVPDGGDDPAMDAVDRLMQQLLDEMLRGLVPGGMDEPFAPDESTEGPGI